MGRDSESLYWREPKTLTRLRKFLLCLGARSLPRLAAVALSAEAHEPSVFDQFAASQARAFFERVRATRAGVGDSLCSAAVHFSKK